MIKGKEKIEEFVEWQDTININDCKFMDVWIFTKEVPPFKKKGQVNRRGQNRISEDTKVFYRSKEK